MTTRTMACQVVWIALAACEQAPVRFVDAARPPPTEDITATAPGAPCGTNEQGEPTGGCSGGQRCISGVEGFPNGYCAPECLTRPCPAGSVCYPASATLRFCLRRCVRDVDCRAAEGYVCRAWSPGAVPGCLPTDMPLGRRDGGACFFEGDASAVPSLAPLPAATFSGETRALTRGTARTIAEAEAVIAVSPTDGAAAVAYMGLDPRGFWRGGLARITPDGTRHTLHALDDFDFPDVLQPAVAYDRRGRVHVAFVASNPDIPGNALRHTAGEVAALPRARSVVSASACALACDAPAMAVGPDVDASRDAIYVAALAGQRDGSRSLFVVRASAEGGDFESPVTVATREVTPTLRRDPAMVALTAGPDTGTVWVSWVAQNALAPIASLGDRGNRVYLRASRDGGRSWNTAEVLSREGDAPVAQVPWVVRGAGVTHVAYVTGGLLGRWDVVLATRRDGEPWRHRVVNDEPESCATHGFMGLAIDAVRGDAHLVWLDARFGLGAVAYARCAADASQRCGRNELVSRDPFVLTTSRDPTRWHGTRSSLARGPDGTLWATWTDARTGGPGVYFARAAP